MTSPILSAFATLRNPIRGSNQFQCEFYAPTNASYELQRTVKLDDPFTGTWQIVATVNASGGNLVTFKDTTATAATGYYRVRYNVNP